ncbi:endoplasmic reticulum mannosyl-oligosaccharide 1,2-alpha-mannosidase [Paracoccidioides lutzii Pb01]|uniref:alpha-1,2-Mannosidase n=1 Tax=Paracoccidioides lutzii (strain ATCC MYA-826 / Pb01) TaxID=502779 RepID=C1H2Y1_PARBA|nr:endoplasmic reticulum mannosyl-oligosaccharide 1,2-alpha-mannosidase [Paracoccidioides lutzii Pb01]EEH34075.1 endoplasmic reticulum mannosyl-oligosaccharide 1,2-alpha-mannosidase [Paracoccidioides lutzii Pb01]
MIFRRRSRYGILAIFLVFLFYLYYRTSPEPPTLHVEVITDPSVKETWVQTHSCHNPSPTYIPPNHNRFKWRNIPVKHTVSSFIQLPSERPSPLPQIQHAFEASPSETSALLARRQEEVKKVFQRGWTSYKQNAWLSDELAPMTGTSKDTLGGWGATLVDSLDTLWIMGLKAEFEEAVTAAVSIDFNPAKTSLETINVFETTIRYLGGFLSAYDLTECKDGRLLDKAVELGDMIYASFDTPNRMPVTRWSPQKAVKGKKQYPAKEGIIAEVASSSMELTRLSQLTGDMRWFDAIQRITNVLDKQQNKTKLPGLWPVGCSPLSADFTNDSTFNLGAMADSAYEYLPKMYALLGGTQAASQYGRLYRNAMDTAMQYLFFRPMVPDNADILISGETKAQDPSSASLHAEGQHLTCYLGGTLALGGRLLSNETHIKIGRKLTDGCIWTYQNTPTGLMPEIFRMEACKSPFDCKFDLKEWISDHGSKHIGFTSVRDGHYRLRPEAIESVFYLYRITGDRKLQDTAWEMFQAIEKHTHTDLANASLRDVMQPELGKEDSMESFWFGETLKYFYLIFSEPDLISLDEFVFNTEAHPFRIPRP